MGLTPREIFEELITPDIFDHIVKNSTRYAIRDKNQAAFTFSEKELKTFIGILIISSYHLVPAERDYWSNEEDLGLDIVKRAMPRDRYLKIKQMLHFCNNENSLGNKSDSGLKLRPFIAMLQKNFIECGNFETHVVVYEIVLKYFGKIYLDLRIV